VQALDIEGILLVDEVDVFFSPHFYGQTKNHVAYLVSQEVEDLLRELWKHRGTASHAQLLIQEVQQWTQYKALLGKYPDIADIVESEVRRMCSDLISHVHSPLAYVCVGNRIGYKELDGINFRRIYGYTTAFAYLAEATKQSMSDEVVREHLALVISCGCWSYANLGSAKILGVSGTIEALGDYEWEVMRQFGIMSYSILPSVYGDNQNFTFLGGQQHEPIMISTSANYFRDITQEAQQMGSVSLLRCKTNSAGIIHCPLFLQRVRDNVVFVFQGDQSDQILEVQFKQCTYPGACETMPWLSGAKRILFS